MFFGPKSTRTIILSYIIVQNYEDLILGKNLDFYRHFLISILIIYRKNLVNNNLIL